MYKISLIFQMVLLMVLSLLLSRIIAQPILLNEIMTKVTGKSQYLEIARNSAESELDLDGLSVLVAKTSTNRNDKRLDVSLAIDLSGLKLRIGQKFAVLGRHESEVEANDLIPFKPSQNFQLVNRQLTAYNWLEIEPTRFMIIFLVHSSTKKIFEDSSIWPFQTGHGQRKKMDDSLQHYLLSNFVDLLFVRGTSMTTKCQELQRIFVPEHLDEVKSIVTTATSVDALSISRCGLEFKKCLFDKFKSSAKTPGKSIVFVA